MPSREPGAPALLLRCAIAGALLGALEVVLVVATEYRLFLSGREIARYAALALPLFAGLSALLGLVGGGAVAWLGRAGDPATLPARVGRVLTLAAWPALALLGWWLTEGRRVRELQGRALLVAGVGLLLAFVLGRASARLLQLAHAPARARAGSVALALIALGALIADALVLRRLYPAFHWALSFGALGCSAAAGALWPAVRNTLSPSRVWMVLALLVPWAAVGASVLWAAPNARYAVAQSAPLTGKLVALAARTAKPRPADVALSSPAPAVRAASPVPQHAGVDLRGRDVLLITVDALRADCLAANGGGGLTPRIDALAAEGALFTRAYTPTPHTSYALASMLTGKYLRPLMSLDAAASDHPTLPDLLRRHGYRTAAFYPPAIFFVDQQRFTALRERNFGFEYVKEMFAPVDQQRTLVDEYLRGVEPGHPVFAWIHVFEPHEPYEPPARFFRGSTSRALYDGEVAAADEGIGRIVESFVRQRPQALVVVSADHGEEHGEHGGHHHGTTLFDEQTRVPLVWWARGVIAPRRIDAAVDLVDVASTLLSALGIPREARMRGDDLTGMLAGGAPPSLHAFASIDDAQMVTDGRLKLVCEAALCRLYDLIADPGELADVARARPEEQRRLQGVLGALTASMPRLEALAMEGGAGWPPVLARARLGDASTAPELVPLLSSPRSEVRIEAARALAAFDARSSRTVLAQLARSDPDEGARAEAVLAAWQLGDVGQQEPVAALIGGAHADRARRAALALGQVGDARATEMLVRVALDEALDEPQRVAAIRALGRVRAPGTATRLAPLLDSVRLRTEVASAFEWLEKRAVVPLLVRALADERYPEARLAEVRALLTHGARSQALAALQRYLGMESSVPGGVALLLASRALRGAARWGWDLRAQPALRIGEWSCEARGCTPGAGAGLRVTSAASSQPSRAVVLAAADSAGAVLSIGERSHRLREGENELGHELPAGRRHELTIRAEPGVRLLALVVVPARAELPPPPKEPWTASVSAPAPQE